MIKSPENMNNRVLYMRDSAMTLPNKGGQVKEQKKAG